MKLFKVAFLAFLFLLAAPSIAQSGDADWLYRGSDIARDPAWRFGTLPNGLRYAVRRNALPSRAGFDPRAHRRRFAARGGR